MSDYNFQNLKYFTCTNSVDPDEMQHYAAFHLGLHCLSKILFSGCPNTRLATIHLAKEERACCFAFVYLFFLVALQLVYDCGISSPFK